MRNASRIRKARVALWMTRLDAAAHLAEIAVARAELAEAGDPFPLVGQRQRRGRDPRGERGDLPGGGGDLLDGARRSPRQLAQPFHHRQEAQHAATISRSSASSVTMILDGCGSPGVSVQRPRPGAARSAGRASARLFHQRRQHVRLRRRVRQQRRRAARDRRPLRRRVLRRLLRVRAQVVPQREVVAPERAVVLDERQVEGAQRGSLPEVDPPGDAGFAEVLVPERDDPRAELLEGGPDGGRRRRASSRQSACPPGPGRRWSRCARTSASRWRGRGGRGRARRGSGPRSRGCSR